MEGRGRGRSVRRGTIQWNEKKKILQTLHALSDTGERKIGRRKVMMKGEEEEEEVGED